MTVVTLASRRAAPISHITPPAQQANELHLIRLHAQACNALHAALRQLTGPDCTAAMWATATARAHRGLSALKQAGALVNLEGGAA